MHTHNYVMIQVVATAGQLMATGNLPFHIACFQLLIQFPTSVVYHFLEFALRNCMETKLSVLTTAKWQRNMDVQQTSGALSSCRKIPHQVMYICDFSHAWQH